MATVGGVTKGDTVSPGLADLSVLLDHKVPKVIRGYWINRNNEVTGSQGLQGFSGWSPVNLLLWLEG